MTGSAERVFDVAVVGAGPAGLAAAAAAAERRPGTVALVDGAQQSGGQFWRGAERDSIGQHHHRTYRALTEALAAGAVTHFASHTVHTLSASRAGFTLRCAVGAEPRATSALVRVAARRLVLACGAYDRQLPFPGWDLPGVLTAGGLQALVKGHGVAAGRRVVVAGTGPFLLPVAESALRAGATVAAVVEAGSPAALLAHPRAWPVAATKLGEAGEYALRLARTRTPYHRRSAVVAVLGEQFVEAVRIARLDRSGRIVSGTERIVECDVVAVGWGFTAQLDLPLQLACTTGIGADGGLVVQVDDEQRTSVPGVWAAGELTGVGGADLALIEGTIAGRSATDGVPSARVRRRRAARRRFAAALPAAYPVPPFLVEDVPDATLICRCEEVPVGAVRAAVREWSATDARTVKLLARPGMGWCQGRVCGYAVCALTAQLCARPLDAADLRAFAERPLAVPVPLGRLAEDAEPGAPLAAPDSAHAIGTDDEGHVDERGA